ncbi:MAG: hypothetical protein HYV75_08310, partial [Opitutae bacterium]|nr:hypothetical protein [Opitutae bacterium]
VAAALDWFKEEKATLLKHLNEGGSYERYFVVLNDHAREAIAVRLASAALKDSVTVKAAASESEKKGGLFSRLFGRK